MHSFKCYWDNEKDWLVIKLPDGQEKCYTKEILEDATAMAFVNNVLMPVSKQYHDKSKYCEAQYMNQPHWEDLLLPGIRQQWHKLTGGWAETCVYSDVTQAFNVSFSQGFSAGFPRIFFEDQKYGDITTILECMAKILKTHPSIGGFDFADSTGHIYTIEMRWKDKPVVKELHVYDLGDGMLVPCELAHEIIQWIGLGKKKSKNDWFMSQEMIEDDMYGAPVMAAVKDIATKIDKQILENAASLFPGKVFIVDDDAIQYMTDPNAFFSVDIESEKFDFIATKYTQKDLMHALLYGQPMKLQAEPTTVAIPKKPAQITKQSLEYFHKLLGGKKDPYIK